jgi:hypothetical protein
MTEPKVLTPSNVRVRYLGKFEPSKAPIKIAINNHTTRYENTKSILLFLAAGCCVSSMGPNNQNKVPPARQLGLKLNASRWSP